MSKRLKGRKLASFTSDRIDWLEANEDDSHAPTASMREEAERGLEWRREYGRGGTEVGVARARDIANGRNLSTDTVKRMASYFARHEADKAGEGWNRDEDGYPSAGRIAWALWGGDAGRTWAQAIVDRLDASKAGTINAAEGEDYEDKASGLPTFQMIAYTGGAMTVRGWDAPVVVDLAGLSWTAKSRPILKDHQPSLVIGHTTAIRQVDGELIVEGVVSATSRVANDVVSAGRNGFPWQASIGADAGGIEFVAEGETATANGREFEGPVYVSRRASLGEVSFVALGADDATEAKVAATAAEQESAMDKKTTEPQGDVAATAAPAETVVDTGDVVAKIRAEAAAEADRIAAIRKVAASNDGIAAKAISEGWDATRAELEVLRAERAEAPAAIVKNSPRVDDAVLEAAACKAANLGNIDKHFDAETLEAADSYRNLGLQEMMLIAARRNGFDGRSVKADTRAVLQAGFATMSLPGIFSNIANKFLLAGFNAVDQAWRQISSTRAVSDFKTVTSYRLNGGFEFEEVGPAGEIKAGGVSEESFTNAAKTYAKMFSVTRQDIINDDLGALSAIPQRIGRGAALAMNKAFWTEFLANGSFFTAGNNNLETSNAFGIDGLTAAEKAFLDQVDADGYPLAMMPSVLLVPTGLYAKANQVMASTEVRDTSTSTKYPVANPHAGKFSVVTSPYLSNAAISGNSATSWYLLANPAELSTIEVAFLNGVETPTVEQADADFNTLGVSMRGYFDFGVAKQEPRAGVKNTA